MGLFDRLFGKMSYEEFWNWFCDHTDDFSQIRTGKEPVCKELHANLDKVKRGLTFAFGHLESDLKEFVVSADGIVSLFEDVQGLVDAAPAISGWKITAFRPPTQELSVQIGDISVNPEDIWFSAEANGDRANIKLYIRDAQRLGKQAAAFGFLILDMALGEYAVEMRLCGMEMADLPGDPKSAGLLPVSMLYETVSNITNQKL